MPDDPRLTGITTALDDLSWETSNDPTLASKSKMRWKMIFPKGRTPEGPISLGLAEIPPDGVLPLHHHEPAEVYHVLDGEGTAEVGGTEHPLRAGVSLFLPANVRHRVRCTGSEPLRFLFLFPNAGFEDVEYHFDE